MVAKPHRWELKCLLCKAGADSPTVDQQDRRNYGDLVAMQRHCMVHHMISQDDFIRTVRVPPLETGMDARMYRWRLPDGRLYLQAKRVLLEPVEMKPGDKSAVDYVNEQRR